MQARVEALEATIEDLRQRVPQQLNQTLQHLTQRLPHQTTFAEEDLSTAANLRAFLNSSLPRIQESKLRPSDKDCVLLLRLINNDPAVAQLTEAERLSVAAIARRHLVGTNLNYRAALVDFSEHSLEATGVVLSPAAVQAATQPQQTPTR